MKIANKTLGGNNACFVIAEAGVNHNGSMDLARKLVDSAKEAGADAIKFQSFTTKNLVTKNTRMADYQGEGTQEGLLSKLELDGEDFTNLKNYCDDKGIIFMLTPHTDDFLELVNNLCPAFKIGSGDLTNLPFLKKIAEFGKPMIIGTGMATLEEVEEALNVINSVGNREVVMLHCTTTYPCPIEDVNLNAMKTMQDRLDCLVGYSDHTNGISVPLMANSMGAAIIEKHFTLDRLLDGPDHKASLIPSELKEMVEGLKLNKKVELDNTVLGSFEKKPTINELEMITVVRKSIIASRKIEKNSIITEKDLVVKRPGTGLKPKYFLKLIGKIAKNDIEQDQIISFSDVIE